MGTPAGQFCPCESVPARDCCGLCLHGSMSNSHSADGDGMKYWLGPELGWGPGQELGPELNETLKHKEIIGDDSTRESVVCLRCQGTEPLRKKDHPKIKSEGSTSRDEAKADPADSLIVTVTPLQGDVIINSTEMAVIILPRPINVVEDPDVEVIGERGEDGDVVDDVEARVNLSHGDDEDDGDKVGASATIDLGVIGDPIVLGVFSPREYTNLVFNVVLYLSTD